MLSFAFLVVLLLFALVFLFLTPVIVALVFLMAAAVAVAAAAVFFLLLPWRAGRAAPFSTLQAGVFAKSLRWLTVVVAVVSLGSRGARRSFSKLFLKRSFLIFWMG